MGNKLINMDCLHYARNSDDEQYERQQSVSSNGSNPESSSSKTRVSPLLDTNNNTVTNNTKPEKREKEKERECIKVLFLDVDGVLNNKYTKWSARTKGIEDDLLKHLKIILDKTKCKIVLSTAWRLHVNYKNILLHELAARAHINVNDVIIGQTPSMPNHKRSTEILTFIHKYNITQTNKYFISRYCVIDDLPLHKYPNSLFLNGHFVRTDKQIGISVFNVISCIQILNHSNHHYSANHQYATKYYYNYCCHYVA